MINIDYPESLNSYFTDSDKFVKKKNLFVKLIFLGIAGFFIYQAILPYNKAASTVAIYWITIISFVIIALVFLLFALLFGNYFYSKDSGGKVKEFKSKIFNTSVVEEYEIVEAFEREDFQFLAQIPKDENGDIEFKSYNNSKGKEIYCLLSYNSMVDSKGITPVKIIQESTYSEMKKVIKRF